MRACACLCGVHDSTTTSAAYCSRRIHRHECHARSMELRLALEVLQKVQPAHGPGRLRVEGGGTACPPGWGACGKEAEGPGGPPEGFLMRPPGGKPPGTPGGPRPGPGGLKDAGPCGACPGPAQPTTRQPCHRSHAIISGPGTAHCPSGKAEQCTHAEQSRCALIATASTADKT